MSNQTQPHDRPRAEEYRKVWEWPLPLRGEVTSILPFAVPPASATSIQNLYMDLGVLRRRWGWRKVGSNLNGNVVGIFRVFSRDGTERVFALTTSTLYEYSSSTGDWISRATGFNGSISLPVSYVVHVNGRLYFTNGVDNLYEYDLDTNTGQFKATGFASPRSVATLAGRLALFNVIVSNIRYPNRVVYSDVGGSFEPGEQTGQVDLIDPDDIILNVKPFRDFIVIRRKKSVWIMQATSETVLSVSGGSISAVPLVFKFERLSFEDSCESPRSMVTTNDEVYFVASRDLRRIRSGVVESVLPLGQSLRPLFEPISDVDMALVNCGVDHKSGSLFVSIPYPSSGALTNQFLVRLSLRTPNEPQFVRVTPKRVFAMGYGTISFPATTYGALSAQYGTYAGMRGLTYRLLAGQKISGVLFGFDNQVYVETESFADSDGGVPSVWRTSLSNFGDPWYKVVERVVLLMKSGEGNITVRLGRSHDGSTIVWSNPQTKSIGAAPQVTFDFSEPEALMWAVEVSSTGAMDLQIGSILAYWRSTSPGRS